MKKSIGCLFLVVCLLLASVPLVFASDSPAYGYIANAKVFNSGWDNENVLKIQLYAPDGNVYEASCAEAMIFNGTSVAMSSMNASEMRAYAEELKGSYIQYTSNTDGEFTGIWYDKTLSETQQVRYDEETQQFVGLSQSAGLPVYYFYNGTMYQPILSENFLYNVQTSTYGILIDSYESQNYDYVMHDIVFDTTIDADFVTRSILVETVLDVGLENYTLKGKLYQDGTLIQEQSAAGCELVFDKLPNKETNYEITLQLFDQSGNAISDVYRETYLLESVAIHFGYIKNAKVFNSTWDVELSFQIQVYDTEGAVETLKFADAIKVNGNSMKISFTGTSELNYYADTMINTYAQYACNADGKIMGIWYDKTLSEPIQVRYDEETQQFEGLSQSAGLPVYYFYNGVVEKHTLSKDFLYTVRTNPYGIQIDDFASLAYDYVMHDIALNMAIDADFATRSILVETVLDEGLENYTLKGKLYQNGTLIQEQSAAGCELVFNKLPNKETNYEIVLQLFDQNGNAISDVYTKAYAAKVVEVSFMYVENAGVFSSGWDNEIVLKIYVPPYEAACANPFYFNGVRYENASAQELNAIAEQVKGTYIKYTATEDGLFSRIDTRYGGCEAAFENVAADAGKVTGTIAFSKAEAKGTAYVSVFDGQGVLVGLASYTFLADGEDIPFEIPCTLQKDAQYTLKLMLWTDGQKPLSVGKAITLVGK